MWQALLIHRQNFTARSLLDRGPASFPGQGSLPPYPRTLSWSLEPSLKSLAPPWIFTSTRCHCPSNVLEDNCCAFVLRASRLRYHGQQGVGDPNMWQITDSGNNRAGFLVYVDDLVLAAPEDVCREVYKWISDTWEATDLEFAIEEHSIRFLGMEIKKLVNAQFEWDGYTIDQKRYINELLRQREVKVNDKSRIPAPQEWMVYDIDKFPATFTQEELRDAQSHNGELLWLAERCRPDVSYMVSMMSMLTSERGSEAGFDDWKPSPVLHQLYQELEGPLPSPTECWADHLYLQLVCTRRRT